jgi:hypothetical protein
MCCSNAGYFNAANTARCNQTQSRLTSVPDYILAANYLTIHFNTIPYLSMGHLNRDDFLDSFTTFRFISCSPIRETFPTKYSYTKNFKMEGGLICGWNQVILSNVAPRDEATNTKPHKVKRNKRFKS